MGFIGRPGKGGKRLSTTTAVHDCGLQPDRPVQNDTGKNKKGSDVNVSEISPFWKIDKGKVVLRDEVTKMKMWNTTTDKDGDITSIYCGLRKEDLGVDGKWIRASNLKVRGACGHV